MPGVNVLDGGGGSRRADRLRRRRHSIMSISAGDDIVREQPAAARDIVLSTRQLHARGAARRSRSCRRPITAATTAINLTGNELANAAVRQCGRQRAERRRRRRRDDRLRRRRHLSSSISAGDHRRELPAGGNDIVYSRGQLYARRRASEVEILSVTDHADRPAINLTGNELANTIYRQCRRQRAERRRRRRRADRLRRRRHLSCRSRRRRR